MKYTFICLFAFAACSKSREEIVKENIKDYLSKTMHDFKSYEPVDYGKIDSHFTSYYTSSRADLLLDVIDDRTKEAKENRQKASIYSYRRGSLYTHYYSTAKQNLREADSLLNVYKVEEKEFTPRFDGFKIFHSFRGKNMNGATIISSNQFYLDSNLVVVRSIKIKDED